MHLIWGNREVPFTWGYRGPYTERLGYKRTFREVVKYARALAATVKANGDDGVVYVVHLPSGLRWPVDGTTDAAALEVFARREIARAHDGGIV